MDKSSGDEFLDYILDTLSSMYEVNFRKMFGGYGLYAGGKIFAIIADQELYFKAANDESSKFYEKFGSEQFSYERDGKVIKMCYWKVPSEILEDQSLLREWFFVASHTK